MIKKNLAFIIPFILLFTFLAKADVPPDKGYVRVRLNLVTETTEDLSDYRFFLDFYGDLREVEIKSKGRTEIPPMGGGARYSSGTFLAIPKKSLTALGEKTKREELANLSKQIKKKEIEGVVELATHRFIADIPAGEQPAETYYVIKHEEKTLKAEQITNEKPKSSSSQPLISSGAQTGYVVGGVLMTLAVLFAGIFAFRKALRKV